jgi:putative transposase
VAAVHYVEMNPVRAGIVKAAWDDPWSRASFHLGKTDTDILVEDRTFIGLIEDGRSFFTNDKGYDEDALRKATRTGRPLGDPSFIESVECCTGRNLKPGQSERPKKRA